MNLTLPKFVMPRLAGLKTWARGLRQQKAGKDLYTLLAEAGTGTTSLERVVEEAARQIGIVFDDMQYTWFFPDGHSTRIDFVMFYPFTAIYVDGPQHDFRPEVKIRDQNERFWLESMFARVVRLDWRDILADPFGAVAKILWGF